ncbi:MAG: hypothetical protein ACFE0Q_21450 [Anaerolineae bacterium]
MIFIAAAELVSNPTNLSAFCQRASSFTLVELSEPLSIDGMVMDVNLDVVAVRQTMLGDSVVRVTSDDDWATATVVATAPALNRSFPTTVTLRDGQPYVLHANFLALQSGTLTLAYEILRTEFTDME